MKSPAEANGCELSWDELAPVVLKACGKETGLWKLGVRLRLGAINAVGPNERQGVPCGIVGVEAIVVTAAIEPGPLVYDAATGTPASVLPVKAARKRRSN